DIRPWAAALTRLSYYNVPAFTDTGLDPEHPPATWAESVNLAKALTKGAGGQNDPGRRRPDGPEERRRPLAPVCRRNRPEASGLTNQR
ncbi:MAG TPA: hypothetical protein VHT52_21010, partial [Stellaceae bacterium]|nr:hypothetical protein [Stellaceae bacterium]